MTIRNKVKKTLNTKKEQRTVGQSTRSLLNPAFLIHFIQLFKNIYYIFIIQKKCGNYRKFETIDKYITEDESHLKSIT